MSRTIRPFATLFGTAILLGGAALQASTAVTQKFKLDFSFHVQNGHKVMPAGEYQVQRTTGSPVVVLKNTKTGESVNMLSVDNTHLNGKTQLVFKDEPNGRTLDRIL